MFDDDSRGGPDTTRRRATWEVVTLGTALTGLGLADAGVAAADSNSPSAQPQPAIAVAGDDSPDAPADRR